MGKYMVWPNLNKATAGNTRGLSGGLAASHNTISSGDSNTLLLITGWGKDDVSVQPVSTDTSLHQRLSRGQGSGSD